MLMVAVLVVVCFVYLIFFCLVTKTNRVVLQQSQSLDNFFLVFLQQQQKSRL